MTNAAQIADELHALAAPLHARLADVEAELAKVQAVVDELKAGRNQLRAALRAVDPTFELESRPGPKSKPKRAPETRIGEQAVKAVREWLEANRSTYSNGNGFTGTELARIEGFPLTQSPTSQALAVLHERGVVRLDHTGRGNSKYYVLV